MNKSYYKIRIIAAFSIITIVLVIVLSRVSYMFVRNLYLDQLSEQVNVVTQMLSIQLDQKYVNLLQFGMPTEMTKNYFKGIFRKNLTSSLHSRIFIFDNHFKIIVSSDSTVKSGTIDARLLLNQKEIEQLNVHQGNASLPFKGDDGKWYLWGFYRLGQNNWLAVRENASRIEIVDKLSSLFWDLGVVGIIISLLTALFLARSITKPLNKLVDFSREIGQGGFQTKIPVNMKGEIAVLAKSMDSMKNNLAMHQKEKERMLAQIAHEIRNPLGGIELLANLTKEDLIKGNIEHGYLDKILMEINRLKILINSYLNYSRPSYSNPVTLDIEKIVNELKNIYQVSLIRKNIRLIKNIEKINVVFDADHLKQILMNLLSNSIDSVNSGGEIKISLNKNNVKWELCIVDNGNGIAEKNIRSIFNPFFTTKKNGTGLGLAICKKLCIENNAEITFDNIPGKGCKFKISKEIVNEK
ncbi:MAG TPA: HAMP domain-containing histidine kinase [Ignavibacteria bacterium]|nr:HAMP domain-containing histidine kinase [Ignavibacteria bacterium]